MDNLKNKTITGFIWRFMQNAGTQIVNFIISIVLARILTPNDYGIVAMVTVFTSIAMVFINVGFSSSIIQKKDLTDTDINTSFYSSLLVGLILYIILFFCSPLIASFYEESLLIKLIKVESLMVVFGSIYSVPQALLTRTLQFKKSFILSVVGMIVQGAFGILFAYNGFGPWALVLSTVLNYFVCAILIWFIVSWKPKLCFSIESFTRTFRFSFQMLIASLLDTIFNNIRSIIIGKQYNSSDLAYYNRGYQFPTLVMTQVDGAVTTVLFSSLSKFQDDWENGLKVLRRAMKTSMYVCTPLMFGLFIVARPMIIFLLTDKWLPSVKYVQLICILCLSWPLSSLRHALNALGKSDVSLKLNFFNKFITLIFLLITYRISIDLMILSTVIAAYLTHCISMFVYRKYLKYSIKEQVLDILPSLILSFMMISIISFLSIFNLGNTCLLFVQISVGIISYILLSIIFKNDSYIYILDFLKSFLKNK